MVSSDRKVRPPHAARGDEVTERYGHRLADPYAWLRDPDWLRVMREPEALQPDIRKHIEAELAFTDAVLEPIRQLREDLAAELKARIKEEDSTVPAPDGPWAYYRRFLAGGQYPILCRRPRDATDDTQEQILLDGNREAEGQSFFAIRGTAHTPDHGLFAFAVDNNGSEYCTVRIKALDTGKLLNDFLENTQGDMAWSSDGRWLFYTLLDDNHRPSKVMRHRVGVEMEPDALIYEEADDRFFLSLDKTQSGRFIRIDAHDHADTSEVRLIDADNPEQPARLIVQRSTGVTYDVGDHGGRLLIRTNADGAVDFKVVEAPLADAAPSNWREIVTHKVGCLILSMIVFENYLVRLERENALPRIVVRSLSDGVEHEIGFDEDAYDISMMRGHEFSTTILRFAYSSPTTPQRVYDYDMASRDRVLLKEQEIPAGHNSDNYVCHRLFAPSHDGVKVPLTVLHARITPIDGTAPMLLYGYGSYGFAMPASFSPHVLSLVDRGFVYAIAHVRGGTEVGYDWYLNGKLKNKRNTFLDFIAAAEHLIARSFTAAGHIVAQGRSAGGMVMGAVANMRPDLFKGIVGEVPFVDVINTMSDETLPLTPPEWVEWGDPVRDPEAFEEMLSYCPYTNIRDQAYPNVLATGGMTDPRVTYWEPVKWVAKLRRHNTGDSEILLWINMQAGHGGASGRFDRLKEIALSYSFALMVTGKASS